MVSLDLGKPTCPLHFFAQVAQLVEHRIEDPGSAGSIPALGTILQVCSRSAELMETYA